MAFTEKNSSQPTGLCWSDLRLMPNEVLETKTQILLANTPTFSPLNPCTTLFSGWWPWLQTHPSYLPVNPSLGHLLVPASDVAPSASQLCPSTVCTHTYFLIFETRFHPGIHLEMEIYFSLNTQMSSHCKSVQRQLVDLTRQRGCEQQLQTHRKKYTVFGNFCP